MGSSRQMQKKAFDNVQLFIKFMIKKNNPESDHRGSLSQHNKGHISLEEPNQDKKRSTLSESRLRKVRRGKTRLQEDRKVRKYRMDPTLSLLSCQNLLTFQKIPLTLIPDMASQPSPLISPPYILHVLLQVQNLKFQLNKNLKGTCLSFPCIKVQPVN